VDKRRARNVVIAVLGFGGVTAQQIWGFASGIFEWLVWAAALFAVLLVTGALHWLRKKATALWAKWRPVSRARFEALHAQAADDRAARERAEVRAAELAEEFALRLALAKSLAPVEEFRRRFNEVSMETGWRGTTLRFNHLVGHVQNWLGEVAYVLREHVRDDLSAQVKLGPISDYNSMTPEERKTAMRHEFEKCVALIERWVVRGMDAD